METNEKLQGTLFLHSFSHPQNPGVDVVSQLLGIWQRNHHIGLKTRITILACLLEFGIYRHGICQYDIAIRETDIITVSRHLASHRPVTAIHLGMTLGVGAWRLLDEFTRYGLPERCVELLLQFEQLLHQFLQPPLWSKCSGGAFWVSEQRSHGSHKRQVLHKQ